MVLLINQLRQSMTWQQPDCCSFQGGVELRVIHQGVVCARRVLCVSLRHLPGLGYSTMSLWKGKKGKGLNISPDSLLSPSALSPFLKYLLTLWVFTRVLRNILRCYKWSLHTFKGALPDEVTEMAPRASEQNLPGAGPALRGEQWQQGTTVRL